MRIAMDFVAHGKTKPVTLYIRRPERSAKDTAEMIAEGERLYAALDKSFDEAVVPGGREDGFANDAEARRFDERRARVWLVLHRGGWWGVKCDAWTIDSMRIAQRDFVRRVVRRIGTDDRGIFRYEDETIRRFAEEGIV